jgi:hypothetical protein
MSGLASSASSSKEQLLSLEDSLDASVYEDMVQMISSTPL